MQNEITYNFADFTYQNYRKLLQLAKKNYEFKFYSEVNSAKKTILWRHDVDMSMHVSRDLAVIEAEEGVKATYFLWLHSQFYNVLEYDIKVLIDEVISLGHQIGLHFDSDYYDIKDENELENYLLFEKNIIENIFQTDIKVFSYHNPSPFILTCKNEKYAGMINTYSNDFQTKIGYCSDSNGYWRNESLEMVLNDDKHNHLQILTHPEWWQKEVMSPKERAKHCIFGRADKNLIRYEHLLQQYGRKLIDWE